jgi:hypothetical protein
LTRVPLNLISNGFYATAKRRAEIGDSFRPTLTAVAKKLGAAIEMHIRDNRIGIPEEEKYSIASSRPNVQVKGPASAFR